MTDTRELLRQYAEAGSEAAFSELVHRHIDFVYSVALRRVHGDAHLAEDVVQTVFADLARKAKVLSPDVVLVGWLHRHACYTASGLVRTARRREARERKALEMNTPDTTPDALPAEVTGLLDEGLNGLAEQDRHALLLRFFQGLDFRAVGAALGVSDDTAQKRVQRALEKLHRFFLKRGVTLSVAALATMLSSQTVSAAPAGLAAAVTSTALAGATVTGPLGLLLLKLSALLKVHTALLVGTVLVVGVGTPVLLFSLFKWSAWETLPIDLTACYDPSPGVSDFNTPNGRWAQAPRGPVTLGGTPFVVGGYFDLRPEPSTSTREPNRKDVVGVPVGRKFRSLHLLHNAAATAEDDAPITRIVFHYEDGGRAETVIRYGYHVRWRYKPRVEQYKDALDSNSRVVWRGEDPTRAIYNTSLRLFKTTLANPVPDKTVRSLDFIPVGPLGGSSIFAATTDSAPCPPGGSTPEPFFDEIPVVELPFRAVDAETGEPIGQYKVHVEATINGQLTWLGNTYTDGAGRTVVRLPRQGIDYFHLWIHKPPATPQVFRWFRPADGPNSFEGPSLPGLPAEYVHYAERSVSIGGKVVDKAGAPVAGALVLVTRFEQILSPDGKEQIALNGLNARTDAAGRWATAGLPKNYSEFDLVVEVPGQKPVSFSPDTRRDAGRYPPVAMSDLLARKATLTLPVADALPRAPATRPQKVEPAVEVRRLIGAVRLPGGEPAVGAHVAVITDRNRPRLGRARFIEASARSPVVWTGGVKSIRSLSPATPEAGVRTDADGCFSIGVSEEPKLIVAAHERGYVEVDPDVFAQDTNLVLQPWGRIEGTVRLGTNAAESFTVSVQRMQDPTWVRLDDKEVFKAFTDERGQFAFDFVPSGSCLLNLQGALLKEQDRPPFKVLDKRARIQVRPGETNRITLGGTGRPVMGKLVGPDARAKVEWPRCTGRLGPAAPVGAEWSYALVYLNESGEFRLEDIPAGRYELVLQTRVSEPGPRGAVSRLTQVLRREVEVPPMPGGRSDEPLDLGALPATLPPSEGEPRK